MRATVLSRNPIDIMLSIFEASRIPGLSLVGAFHLAEYHGGEGMGLDGTLDDRGICYHVIHEDTYTGRLSSKTISMEFYSSVTRIGCI